MLKLLKTYRNFHEQSFIPIFCHDIFDSKREVEACIKAGCKVLEYTLRKDDAKEMIPWIKKNFPEISLLVGSTIDDEKIVCHMRKKYPQLMTLKELADLGVDGFVSMIGWTEESIQIYRESHLVVPSAMTMREALIQTGCGAHFQKMLGSDLDLIKRTKNAATFNFCPVMVTGGQKLEMLDTTFASGAVVVASGFDLTLKDQPADISVGKISDIVKDYISTAKKAKKSAYPGILTGENIPDSEWLESLPHYHPFTI